ncbi:MAG TPA: septal ring lytic transglycosylase RlpA family protein [Aestuariivirgaceae bacterium]|nr:septal ring lytic transglycosylase RlpA family protein [Aestuariivirgaceae bacterium]
MRKCVVTVATAACCGVLLAGPLEAGSSFKQEGKASWYKMGTKTANGERYDPMGITAAHPSLPFHTKVRVTNPASGKSVVVRINDRGPFTGGRIIDLSQGAAQEINLVKAGVAKVSIEVLGSAAPVETAAAEAEPEPVAAEAPPVRAEPLLLMAEQRMGHSSR